MEQDRGAIHEALGSEALRGIVERHWGQALGSGLAFCP